MRSALALWVLVGCAAAPLEPRDDSLYLQHTPRSILVLPPMNESMDVEATSIHLATITRPLAELGYYVFPVAVVERLMRQNGLPTAWEMHQVSLEKLDEVVGPDAVLYLSIIDWGTEFQVVNSSTHIALRGRLVDVETGLQLWEGEAELVNNEPTVGTDPISMIVIAVGSLVKRAARPPPEERLSREMHDTLLRTPEYGLLLGPRHPGYAASRDALRAEMEARAKDEPE